MKTEYPVRTLCAVLEVSPSGYYAWCVRRQHPGPRAQEEVLLARLVETLHVKSRKTYGAPRLQADLRQLGRKHGRNRIARILRQKHLRGRPRKRFRVRTTDSQHDQPVAPNRLAQQPPPTAPNQVWVGDITYIFTAQGWLFLAGILDLYSRRIVGWAMGPDLDTQLVLRAWQMAWAQRRPPPGLLFHSDRGVQYASQAFRHALQSAQASPSMSRRACCYDNAAMESFWSSLKWELIFTADFATRAQARTAIFDYIEVFYNRRRRHSSLGYRCPVDFEALSLP